MKEIIKLIIKENEQKKIKITKRDFKIPKTNKIITITGHRRVGKTFYFFQLMNNTKNNFYFNFDDDRLISFSIKNFDQIIESYFELYPERINEINNFYFDEIQEIQYWEKFIRRIYDLHNINLYITGSSSKLSSKEIATSLRGRTLSFNLLPVSFKEYLKFKKIDMTKNDSYSKKRFIIKKEFNKFLNIGGFPETVDNPLYLDILQNYIDLMIYKDLIERYKIKNFILLKALIKFLASNISKEFSINAYYKSIKQNTAVSRDTITEYFSYLEDVQLVFSISRFNYSLKSQQRTPKKIYFIDNGLSNAVSFRISQDKGRLLENLVFIELKRRNHETYYHKEKHECDFVIKEKNKITQAIQVCNYLDEENKKRETKGLLEAMTIYKLKTGLILTNDQEKTIKIENKTITIKPIWKWLLE